MHELEQRISQLNHCIAAHRRDLTSRRRYYVANRPLTRFVIEKLEQKRNVLLVELHGLKIA